MHPFIARLKAALSHPVAPVIGGGVFLVSFLFFFGARALGVVSPSVVVFDPVRFMNAQRAAASYLLKTPDPTLSFALTQVAKQAESVILEEADGALVLVRQAVVVPAGTRDITDAVLARFGLPTNVPTLTGTNGVAQLEDVAPTDSAFSAGRLREDVRLSLDNKQQLLQQTESAKSDLERQLP